MLPEAQALLRHGMFALVDSLLIFDLCRTILVHFSIQQRPESYKKKKIIEMIEKSIYRDNVYLIP
jgi:hypothetical protein